MEKKFEDIIRIDTPELFEKVPEYVEELIAEATQKELFQYKVKEMNIHLKSAVQPVCALIMKLCIINLKA